MKTTRTIASLIISGIGLFSLIIPLQKQAIPGPDLIGTFASTPASTPAWPPFLYLPFINSSFKSTPAPIDYFIETFDGNPSSPLPWKSSNWDIAVHTRNRDTLYELEAMDAAHGPECEPPPLTHPINQYEETVYQCKDHLMTAINDSNYGVIYLTPNQMVDFSQGEAVIRFDISTKRASLRDWVDIWISPYGNNLQLPGQDWLPDLQGPPEEALLIDMQFGGNNFLPTFFRNYVEKKLTSEDLGADANVSYEDFLDPSATVRTTFELRISRTHLKFGIPDQDHYWIDTSIDPPLTWDQGVVQLGHHSYTPEKDCQGGESCLPNTWHWDNIEIRPSTPFTIIHSDRRFVNQENPTVKFEQPAPGGSHLRFSAIGSSLEISFDNGKTWRDAEKQAQLIDVVDHFSSYWMPVPAGVSNIQFRGQNWWGSEWHVRNISIWSTTAP